MNRIMIVASAVLLLLAVAPLSVRAESPVRASNNDTREDDISSACKTIIRLTKVYPQFNLTVPPSCKAWEDSPVKKQCTELKANLRVGDRGERVRVLHQVLTQAGYGPFVNDEFDEQTAAAVVGFQEQYRSEVLAPYGLVRGTGYVGVSTRAKLNALFGCVITIPPSQTVSLRIISAPSTLKVNETGTWKLGITTASSSDYTIAVTWGDEPAPTTGTTASAAEKRSTNTTTFTHSYATAGTYTVTFRLISGGETRTITRRIEVKKDGTGQKITVISPNGGESWGIGETRTISWNSSQEGQVTVWIYMEESPCLGEMACITVPAEPLQIARLNSREGTNSYSWRIGAQYGTDEGGGTIRQHRLVSGNYFLRICSAGRAHCDHSDNTFTITAPTATNRAPSITSVSGPTSLEVGKTGTWKIRAYDPDGEWLSYSILWGDETVADVRTAVGTSSGATVSQQTSFTHTYTTAGTYTVKITVTDTAGKTAQSTQTVVVRTLGSDIDV